MGKHKDATEIQTSLRRMGRTANQKQHSHTRFLLPFVETQLASNRRLEAVSRLRHAVKSTFVYPASPLFWRVRFFSVLLQRQTKGNTTMKKIMIITISTLALCSCNVTRVITNESQYLQRGDTSIVIQTKTVETYDASKKL